MVINQKDIHHVHKVTRQLNDAPSKHKNKKPLTRDGESDLGALTWSGLNLRRAADAVHAFHDGVPDAVAVFGNSLRIKTCAAIANENRQLAGEVLGVDINGIHTGMLAGIDHSFARGHHRTFGVFRQRDVFADGHRAN